MLIVIFLIISYALYYFLRTEKSPVKKMALRIIIIGFYISCYYYLMVAMGFFMSFSRQRSVSLWEVAIPAAAVMGLLVCLPVVVWEAIKKWYEWENASSSEAKKQLRSQAIAKLTEEERKALGV